MLLCCKVMLEAFVLSFACCICLEPGRLSTERRFLCVAKDSYAPQVVRSLVEFRSESLFSFYKAKP